jgi:deoxyribonuclease-4
MTTRVRPLLNSLNSVERAELKKLLPPKLTVPVEPEGVRYPAALLAQLAAAQPTEQYSLAGCITEELLHHVPADITMDLLASVAKSICPALNEMHIGKVAASKTTEPYLVHIRETRKKMRLAARGPFRYEEEVGAHAVRGHPDARTDTQVFEIKMTGQLKENWIDFLFQVFAYAALVPEVTDLYLVLPLQEILWHYDVTKWAKREAYRTFLETAATKKDLTSGPGLEALLLIQEHAIGSHMPKLRTLVDTVASLPAGKPSQIFLGSPQSGKWTIKDDDLAAASAALKTPLFVHSQYIINLCSATWNDVLIKNLQTATALGARGVVVHVGKSLKQTIPEALEAMRANIALCLPHATAACPLLLETPAGQGTELLCEPTAFIEFVASFNDPRLRICVDTCHVFVAGHDPLAALEKAKALTTLVHFNDSATPCGSCLDRHAFVGQGHIGLPVMRAIAEAAAMIPKIIE